MLYDSWSDKYMVVKERKLRYFKSSREEDLHTPEGVINMDYF